MRVPAAVEVRVGKPAIAINIAAHWHALRMDGIEGRMTGFGPLLEKF